MTNPKKSECGNYKRSWKLQPSCGSEVQSGRWQAERIPLSQGIKECPVIARVCYVLLCVISFVFHIYAYTQLPEMLTVATWFELGQSSFSKGGFLAVSFGLLIYLIYRDLVHKSLSRYLLVIPAFYFCGSCFLVASLMM